MKRELISAVIGAGITSMVWAGSAYFRCAGEKPTAKTEAAADSQSKNPHRGSIASADARHPGRMRKLVEGVYSTLPEKNFPGLKLYSNDFLIPLNRLYITRHILVDDPEGFYGSGGRPMCACLFGIHEDGGIHYFLASADQDGDVGPIVYLGRDIDIEKVEHAGNGYWLVTYKDKQGKTGRGYVPIQGIFGDDPVKDAGIAQWIGMDPLNEYAEDCDPFVWEMNAEQFWRRYQKAIRENDRLTIAKMHRFPIGRHDRKIYTRAEFMEKYDSIYTPGVRESILNSGDSIMYSWRGARLPNGAWLVNASGKNDPAGPLED